MGPKPLHTSVVATISHCHYFISMDLRETQDRVVVRLRLGEVALRAELIKRYEQKITTR